MRALLRRPSLLTKFSVLSLLVIVALGLGVGAMLHQRIERRALLEATKLAETMTSLGLAADPAARRPHGRPARVPPRCARRAAQAARLRHARDPPPEGLQRRRGDRLLRRALDRRRREPGGARDPRRAGRPRRRATSRRRPSATAAEADSLEVYVPLRLGGGEPDGVVEVYLPYEPVGGGDRRGLRPPVPAARPRPRAALRDALPDRRGGLAHAAPPGAARRRSPTCPTARCSTSAWRRRWTAAERSGEAAALLLIDLDRFKEVNDTLGHDSGDRLLEEVAVRLREARAPRRHARPARRRRVRRAAARAPAPRRRGRAGRAPAGRARAARSCSTAWWRVLDASIGIAHCPEHGTRRAHARPARRRRDVRRQALAHQHRDLLRRARPVLGRAAAAARRAARARSAPASWSCTTSRRSTSTPSASSASRRWCAGSIPCHGLLPPAEFVPLAERTGAIGDLTRWVLDNALAQARVWRDAGLDLTMAVNLAAPNIADATLPDVGRRAARAPRGPRRAGSSARSPSTP